uniref:Uncharacterized protein n=1 Tax=Rhizophora mucronata TaxID=61149 RepID=A0A2P2PDS5_RHIMU
MTSRKSPHPTPTWTTPSRRLQTGTSLATLTPNPITSSTRDPGA